MPFRCTDLRTTFEEITLPETNIAHENPIFPGKYHQNCGFSMAMLVSGSVTKKMTPQKKKKRRAHPRKPQRKLFSIGAARQARWLGFPGRGLLLELLI